MSVLLTSVMYPIELLGMNGSLEASVYCCSPQREDLSREWNTSGMTALKVAGSRLDARRQLSASCQASGIDPASVHETDRAGRRNGAIN